MKKLNNTKIGRLINSYLNNNIKNRIGKCEPQNCETLKGETGAACCRLGYNFFALKNCDCSIYKLRPRNCRVFPANANDLKLVINCSYQFL